MDIAAHHSEGRRVAIEWGMKKRLLIPLVFALAGALSVAVRVAGANTTDWALPVGKTLTCPNGFTLTVTGRSPDGSLRTKNGAGEAGYWTPKIVAHGMLYVEQGPLPLFSIFAPSDGKPISVFVPDGEITGCTLG
jgi:hypothetical protein